MDTVIKIECTPNELDDCLNRHLVNCRFVCFDYKENGFDPAIMTREQWDEECRDVPWTYVMRVRHADFGNLNQRYGSIRELVDDLHARGNEYVKMVKKLREQRRKEA